MEFADFSIFSVLFTVLGGLWFIVFNIFPSFKKQNSFKTKMLYGGTRILKVFFATAILSVILIVAGAGCFYVDGMLNKLNFQSFLSDWDWKRRNDWFYWLFSQKSDKLAQKCLYKDA